MSLVDVAQNLVNVAAAVVFMWLLFNQESRSRSRRPMRDRDVEQLVSLLLARAGSWFVLQPALAAAAALERERPSADGREWASRVMLAIDTELDRSSPKPRRRRPRG